VFRSVSNKLTAVSAEVTMIGVFGVGFFVGRNALMASVVGCGVKNLVETTVIRGVGSTVGGITDGWSDGASVSAVTDGFVVGVSTSATGTTGASVAACVEGSSPAGTNPLAIFSAHPVKK
jgi:hypothetical protein